jgi:hypothetical protein
MILAHWEVERLYSSDTILVAQVNKSTSALDDMSTLNTENQSSLSGMSAAKASAVLPKLNDTNQYAEY